MESIKNQKRSNINKGGKRKILFVTYGGGHVNMVLPIAKTLKQRQDFEVHILGLTTSGCVFQREGIPFLGFRDFLRDSDQHALKLGEKLTDNVSNRAVSYKETVAYLGLSYDDLEKRHGVEEAARLYAQKGRQAFLPLTLMERIFEEIKPHLLVSTNSPRAERAAIMIARKQNVPAICIVGLLALQEVEWIGKQGYGDKICVLFDYMKKLLVSSERKPDEIIVTGNPAFDRLAHQDLDQKAKEMRIARGWGEDPVILWASQVEPRFHPVTGAKGDPKLPRRIERVLFKIMERYPCWRLVIRLHPGETVQLTNLPERVVVSPQEEDLSTVLKAVDAIVTMTSTVGLEGALLEKPFIALNVSVFTPDAPFTEMGIARGVENLNENEIEEAILEALEGRWKPTANLPKIGTATQNVIDVIEDTLEGHSL